MISFLIVLAILIAFLLVVVVLVQNPKGGGIDSSRNFSQLGSVKKQNDFIEKATWTLGVLLAVVSLVAASFVYDGKGTTGNNTDAGGTGGAPVGQTDTQTP